MAAQKLLYVRSGPYQLSFSNYNLQEVGLATAFCEQGFDCDILYYSKENRDQIIQIGERQIRILWRKGIKILRSGIYPCILKKDFLSQYDIIIVSEYSQLMSVFISHLKKNVYVYNGPYYNLFKLPFIQPIYDKLFVKDMNQHIKKVFVKSELSKRFLAHKGINNLEVVGVGLDISKYNDELEIKIETQTLIEKMTGQRNLLYVGSLSKRKNFKFLVQTFKKLKRTSQIDDIQLVVIGKGDQAYIKSCLNILNNEERESVIMCAFIENAQLKYIYPLAKIFLLPSVKEIFGMVLLEAMYFGIPVISSLNGGSATLIETGANGIIINEFDTDVWGKQIDCLLSDANKAYDMGKLASETIKSNFMWSSISKKMLDNIKV
ncbi:MAG: glycosyltransferase family 4 protein [Clostridium sp.]|uniref:glycosyltransferase family 4 protein n=1 Tax=Clostridium sp. TaxID=1506 RepID=UPI003D6D73B6